MFQTAARINISTCRCLWFIFHLRSNTQRDFKTNKRNNRLVLQKKQNKKTFFCFLKMSNNSLLSGNFNQWRCLKSPLEIKELLLKPWAEEQTFVSQNATFNSVSKQNVDLTLSRWRLVLRWDNILKFKLLKFWDLSREVIKKKGFVRMKAEVFRKWRRESF